ncbi:MAG: hypothetical protein HC837_02950 [Chloroflexaceae bacterium]|nr:hypothetical protein [Chloroflexaceae bacterium]
MGTRELLKQGIDAAKAGQREEALKLLTQVVEEDDRNELAWLWISSLVETPEDKRVCLENVLTLNPSSTHALRGLELLNAQHLPPAPTSSTESSTPSTEATPATPQPAAPATPEPAQQPAATGPTVALAPASESAKQPAAAGPAAATDAPDESDEALLTHACPSCGQLVTEAQRTCPNCFKKLRVRYPPEPGRSPMLMILGVLWIIGGVLPLLMTLGVIGFAAYTLSQVEISPEMAATADTPSIGNVISSMLPCLITPIFSIIIGMGLLKRQLWAYILNWLSLLLNLGLALLIFVLQIVLVELFFSLVTSSPDFASAMPADQLDDARMGVTSAIGTITLCHWCHR